MAIKYYSFEIKDGQPKTHGPYDDYKIQAATIRAMNAERKLAANLSGESASEVFFLDIHEDDDGSQPSMGRIPNER